MLATYMWHMRNNNLEIRIARSSYRPQLYSQIPVRRRPVYNCVSFGLNLYSGTFSLLEYKYFTLGRDLIALNK